MIHNVWLIGAGRWGSKINEALSIMGHNVRIIDPKIGSSINDVDNQDPVIIATPTHLHFEHAMHFLTRGHDIFIEKPASEFANQIQSLMKVRRKEQIVMVGHLFLYHPFLRRMRDIIASEKLGDIRFVHCERTNLGKYHDAPILLNNIALHDFTLIDNLFNITDVSRCDMIKISNSGYPDRACIIGNAGNVKWQIDASWLDMRRRRMMTVVGNKGQACWDEDKHCIEVMRTDIANGELYIHEDINIHYDSQLSPLQQELQHFLDCITYRQNPKTGLESALRINQLIESATIL